MVIQLLKPALPSHKYSCSPLQPIPVVPMAILLVILISQRNFAQDLEQVAVAVVHELEDTKVVINGFDANAVAANGDELSEQPASAPTRNGAHGQGKDKFSFYVDDNAFHLNAAAADTLKVSNAFETRKNASANSYAKTFQWQKALLKSELLVGIQQLWRLHIQPYTRNATFRGPYLKDVWQAEKNSFKGGWDDGDGYWINYVQHPFSGGVYAQVWCDAMPKCANVDFGKNTNYLINGVLKPLPWSALMSLNFENGPVSESTLGKVAFKKGVDGRYGMVDYFATPLGGISLKAATDAYHTYVRKPFDLREVQAREEFTDHLRHMIATDTLTQSKLDKASKKIPFGTRHTIALLIIRLADFNHMLSDALEFKNPARNTSAGLR
jgi:hypothetical protein